VSALAAARVPTPARRRAPAHVVALGVLAALAYAAMLGVLLVAEEPRTTWLAIGIYVVAAAAFAAAAVRRYPWVLFVLPGLSLYVLFAVFPTAQAIRYSLYNWTGIGEPTNFVGLKNLISVLSWPTFYNAAWHNILLFVSIFVLQNTVALLIAVLLNGKPRFFEAYRAAIFFPGILSLVAAGMIWQVIFGSNIGLLSPALDLIGLGVLKRDWLGDTTLTFWLLVLVQFWHWMGLPMIIYLAGLQNVPDEITDAARIDGATDWQVFRHVTFPLLAPAFTVVTGLSFIVMFRTFDIPFIMAGAAGTPDGTTDVLGLVIYRTAFGMGGTVETSLRQGYAVAVGVVMFLAILIVDTLQLAVLRRREVDG
jgi:raffinose/stachyose/melibiose transport system permease protein